MSILARIQAQGGEVTRDRWRLSLRKGRLSADAIAWLSKHKDQLMRELWPAYDDWAERAAIMEYDGLLSRDEAERRAYDEVCKC